MRPSKSYGAEGPRYCVLSGRVSKCNETSRHSPEQPPISGSCETRVAIDVLLVSEYPVEEEVRWNASLTPNANAAVTAAIAAPMPGSAPMMAAPAAPAKGAATNAPPCPNCAPAPPAIPPAAAPEAVAKPILTLYPANFARAPLVPPATAPDTMPPAMPPRLQSDK